MSKVWTEIELVRGDSDSSDPFFVTFEWAEMGFGLGYLLAKTDIISTSTHSSVVSINLFIALLCACIVIGHLLEENRWMNESITALVIVSLFTN